jgi:hypothetical protein
MWLIALAVAFWLIAGYAFAIEQRTSALTFAAIWLVAYFFLPFAMSVIVRAVLPVALYIKLRIGAAI